MQISRTRLAQILSVQGMHNESTMSRLQELGRYRLARIFTELIEEDDDAGAIHDVTARHTVDPGAPL